MSEDEKLKIPQIDILEDDGETRTMRHVSPASVPAVDVIQSELTDEELDEQLAFEQLERHRKQRRRKKRIRIGLAVALALGAVVAWFATHPPVPEAPAWQPVTAYAYRGDFVSEISSNGATMPLKLSVVTPEVDGIIQDVQVVEGQQVREGDVLFTIKSDELDRAISEAEKAVSSAQSGVNSAYTSRSDAVNVRDEAWEAYDRAYEQYRRDYKQYQEAMKDYPKLVKEYEEAFERYEEELAQYNTRFWTWYVERNRSQNKNEELTEEERAYEQQLYEEIETKPVPPERPEKPTPPTAPEPPEDAVLLSSVHSADDAISAASEGLDSAYEALSEAQENADRRTVRAPVTGTVITMNAVEGASTVGGQGSGPLIQIADLTQMKVTVEVSEIDIRNIEVGQRGVATFSALPGVELEAIVEKIASTSSSGGEYGGGLVTYAVDLLIPNPDPALKPGMTATVVIRTQDVPDTIIVPVAALIDNGDGTYSVNVVIDEETWESELRTVEVIAQNSSEAAVRGDIADGDQVIMGDAGMDEDMYDSIGYGG